MRGYAILFVSAPFLLSVTAVLGAGTVKYEVVDGTSIPAPLTEQPGDVERGKAVAIERTQGHCLACHAIPTLADQPFHGTLGPNLAGVADRYEEGELRLRIVHPKLVNPETIMPAFYRREGLYRVAKQFEDQTVLTAQQVEDVLAFLLTLKGEAPSTAPPSPHDRLQSVAIEAPPDSPYPWLFSGRHVVSEAKQAMQADEGGNPGLLWVERGAELWQQVEGEAGKSCAGCHGAAEDSMEGVGARYPVYHEPWGKLISLEQRINLCRTEQMHAEEWGWGTDELNAMTTFVRHQSRGIPVDVAVDGAAAPFFEAGKEFYYQRRGLLDMSCAQCHEHYYGEYLRGDLLSQGQTNEHPIYYTGDASMEWLHGLFAHCNSRVRSEPFAPGAEEYVNLELYLAWRGQGMPVGTPGVR